jgi:L-2-hydroxyglutarate oxidase LhgO
MPARSYDVVVVGAGIVGLASARSLLERRPKIRVAVLEKEDRVAAHQTGHNSGVVHSGIYYRPGSLKARLCREGARRLERFCEQRGIPLRRLGKLIVASTPAELPRLAELERRGRDNGVAGLEALGADQLTAVEPRARGLRALHSPQTAVVDFGRVAQALADELREQGAAVLTSTEVLSIRRAGGGLRLVTAGVELEARGLINCAGLQADRIARMAGERIDLRIVPFRGDYFELRPERADWVRGLIYPVPDPAFPFLGVHLTRTVDGRVEVGPNATLAFAREGYRWSRIDPAELAGIALFPGWWRLLRRYGRTAVRELTRSLSRAAFARAAARLVPELSADDLVRGGSGVRAQAVRNSGELIEDFEIRSGPAALHLLNAPSPAATASLAIGAQVADRALELFALA